MRTRLRKNSWPLAVGSWQSHKHVIARKTGIASCESFPKQSPEIQGAVNFRGLLRRAPLGPVPLLAMTMAGLLALSFLSSCNSKKTNHNMNGMEMTSTVDSNSGEYLNNLAIPSDKQKMVSSLPTIHPLKKTMPEEVIADGTIEYDTRQERNIATRYSGRIEKLYVKYLYQPVKQGEVLLEIYSPEMMTEQQNLLFLLSDTSTGQQLISASKRKLMLLGLTEEQIEQVINTREPLSRIPVYSPYEGHIHDASIMNGTATESKMNSSNANELLLKEGMYVQKGQTLFNILNPHMIWAVLRIYSDDAAKIKLNQPVELNVEGTEKKLRGQIDFIEPFFQPNSKTLSARVYLSNEVHALKVGMYVRATIKEDSVSGIWIPKVAMLDLGKHKVVFLRNENVFQPHEIKTGIESGDFIRVTEGLSEEDEIAANAQYIQDSESFIK